MNALKRFLFIISFIIVIILSIALFIPLVTFIGHIRYINIITPMFEFCNRVLE